MSQMYPGQPFKDRIDRLLDDLEARQAPPGSPRAFE